MERKCNYDDIIIDEKFARIFPVLNERTSAELEESILEFGCILPIVLWDGILIDGHNRFQILKKHGLPFNTINLEFASRDLVEIWIIENQITRRNLTSMQLSYYRGMHYHLEKRVQGSGSRASVEFIDEVAESKKSQNETFTGSTAKRLAEQYSVSRATITRDALVANAISAIGDISPDVKMEVLSGKTRITRKQLKELATGTKKDVSAIVAQIEEGTFEGGQARALSVAGREGDAESALNEADMKPWERQFISMTDEFRQLMRNHAKSDDTAAVRSALRQYIDMLEGLYGSI